MDLRLAGKTAVVTGGSKGIGLEVVRQLIDEGVRVVSGSRSITAELKETGAIAVSADLSTPDGPKQLIDEALTALGGIDILVNNAGIGDHAGLVQGVVNNVLTLPDSAWEQSFNVNFYSALRTSRAAMPSLIERDGVIVNVSSVGARLPGVGPADYNIAKTALNGLTKALAEQFGPQGVRAIGISPGPVSTGVWEDPDGFVGQLAKAQGVDRHDFADQFLANLGASTGRVSTPEEVARLIVFAVSPNNITGTDYLIDGGAVKTA
ncbi:NAD(P)-dependent dehydrogenase (short-subunit alcohol dehydrogenase family) [Kibdelosporangium banguiense]|uniref:NAD(P)-dependent dehydrogenase (Short-subunit alcohol dehydrogenase family) n=1 Tax=Kibdelosporangium banguiense TaxID=1365924 RepID=A0ABS4U0X7_9PSEU|nr:SDR family NAD(P)-dependent oxidoreductase [Kibdelosporangium banguiense]MBP2329855.1 NAD(P)-dependent dehydrogenase (short-subunit alcohol dehydrogenase family) [Kibdelosporangium banguiense]